MPLEIALRDKAAFDAEIAIIDELKAYFETQVREHFLQLHGDSPDQAGPDQWFFDLIGQDQAQSVPMMQSILGMADHNREIDSCLRISIYLAASKLLVNSLDGFYRATITPDSENAFTDFLETGFRGSDAQRAAFAKSLKDAAAHLRANFTQTLHPVIYHSEFAIEIQAELNAALESAAHAIKEGKSPAECVDAAKRVIDKLITGIARGEDITPTKKITLAQETRLGDKFNAAVNREALTALTSYNAAIDAFAASHQEIDLTGTRLPRDAIIPRRWDKGGADADGRHESTAIVLYDAAREYTLKRRTSQQDIEPLLDLRDNASKHMHVLAQALMQTGNTGSKVLSASPATEDVNIRAQRTALLQGLLTSTTEILPANLFDETKAFHAMFHERYPDFLKSFKAQHKLGNELVDLDEPPTLHGLLRLYKSGRLPEHPIEALNRHLQPHEVVIGKEPAHFRIHPENLTYGRVPENSPDVPDLIRRLHVVRQAIEADPAHPIADRYQIANFGGTDDFYAALLLAQQTGLVRTQNSQVIGTPMLSIQPLLENYEDQRNAKAIFQKLLQKGSVTRDYYRALGERAEIMVGYSDGAKSAGVFASEWSIIRCTAELRELFAQEGIKLTVFHGRGRGYSRGGHGTLGMEQIMKDADGLTPDQTLQGTVPMNIYTSHMDAQNAFTGFLTGAITTHHMTQQGEHSVLVQKDKIDKIADRSREIYLKLVGEHPHALQLLAREPDNSNRSSRDPQRKPPNSLNDVRAITVEAGFTSVDAPLLFIGLNTALKEFVAENGIEAAQQLYEANVFFRGMMDKTCRAMNDFHPEIFKPYAIATGTSKWADECIREMTGLQDLATQIQGPHGFRAPATERETIANIVQQPPTNDPDSIALRIAQLAALSPVHEEQQRLDILTHEMLLRLAVKGDKVANISPDHNPFRPNEGTSQARAVHHLTFAATRQLEETMDHPTPNQTLLPAGRTPQMLLRH